MEPGRLGLGTESIEAIELVTAEGNSSRRARTSMQNISGGARIGPGFFGVVTRYHLKLHPLPWRSTAAPIIIP